MGPLTRFGTYGFLCAVLASQLSLPALSASENEVQADRAWVNTKKSARAVKRDVKKTGRDMTGHGSTVKDFKDKAHDAVSNTKDEFHHAKKRAE